MKRIACAKRKYNLNVHRSGFFAPFLTNCQWFIDENKTVLPLCSPLLCRECQLWKKDFSNRKTLLEQALLEFQIM